MDEDNYEPKLSTRIAAHAQRVTNLHTLVQELHNKFEEWDQKVSYGEGIIVDYKDIYRTERTLYRMSLMLRDTHGALWTLVKKLQDEEFRAPELRYWDSKEKEEALSGLAGDRTKKMMWGPVWNAMEDEE